MATDHAKTMVAQLRNKYCPGCSLEIVGGTPMGVFRRADKIHAESGSTMPDCFLQAIVGETFDAIMDNMTKQKHGDRR